jgi:hypothetical protein
MAIARMRQIDASVARWYHCMSRCVRRAFLLKKRGLLDRKAWIENRIAELAQIFAIAVGGFSVMNNHIHLLLRIDPAVRDGWSDEEVVRRWGRLFPPRDNKRRPLPISDAWVHDRVKDRAWVARARERLGSISWFMKCLKEPLARLANREDKARGAFFASRFKSVAILDEASLLAVCAYIDLNPVAAGIAISPESSDHTSIKARVEHVEAQGQTAQLEAANNGSVAGSLAAAGVEESLWLCPIEDRRGLDSSREGMVAGFSLGSYLLLVDYTGRLFRAGKAVISAELADVFARLRIGSETWQARLKKLRAGRWLGRVFAATRERLKAAAERLGVGYVRNLSGCPAA